MSVASTSKSVILEIEEESPSSSQRLEIEEESLHPPIMEVQKEYPYPSHNFATNIVTVKLSGKAKYSLWNAQMLCLLSSHDMLGFIDGTFPCPSNRNGKAKYGDMKAWHRSDSLVKGWILGSLSEEVAINVVNHLNSDFTAKAVWDELQCCYGPSVPYQQVAEISIPQDEAHDSTAQSKMEDKQALYKDCLRGRWYTTRFTPVDKITNNGNTALHVAVGSSSKNHKFLEELLESTPAENTLLDVQNSDGSTPLHVAAIVGNTEAAKILLRRNRNLLFATDKAGHTPLAISLSNMHIETFKCLLEHITEKENETVFTGKSGDELLVLAISSKNWEFASELLGRYGTIHSEAVLRAMSQNYPRRCNFWDGLEDYFEYQRQEELERATVELLLYGNRALELLLKMKPRRAARLRRRFVSGIFMIRGVPLFLFRKAAWSFMRKRYKNRVDAGCLLRGICAKIKYHSSANTYHHYYNNTIFEATKQNASDVVQSVVSQFTYAIWCINEDGHNFIQYE